MWTLANAFLCGLVVVVAQVEEEWEADRPYQKVRLNNPAVLECCYSGNNSMTVSWVKFVVLDPTVSHQHVNSSSLVTQSKKKDGSWCNTLSLSSAQLNDSGLYQCYLKKQSKIGTLSHGTFLHVYKPLQKTLNLSENTKNRILTVEGILLLLCVLLPATTLLCQRKRLNEVEKCAKDTENIYQGLNLDECWPKHDQIEHYHNCDLYQDVCNPSHADDFQLEKP